MAIVAALAALAAPRLHRAPSRAVLSADATRLAAALRLTRAAAMARNRDMALVLDADRHAYGSPAVPAAPLDPRVAVAATLSETERQGGSRGGVRFFPSGRSSGGAFQLRLAQWRTQVRVVWATGDVPDRRVTP